MQHEILQDLKRVASELGHAPTYTEYIQQQKGKFSERQIRKYFKNFTGALIAAGLQGAIEESAKKKTKFKYVPLKLQGFVVHELDLDELFERAGNPEVLKLIAQPDTHVPFHDEAALSALLSFSRDYRPDVWQIMGDFADMAGISHWPSDDLKPRRLIPEMIEARKVLKQIQEASESVSTRIYISGNHENWLEQAKVAKLPELFDGIEELGIDVSLAALLNLNDFDYTLYPMNDIIRIGHANFSHGIYAGNNHPKTHLDKLKKNFYYGHLHDTKAWNDTGMDGPIEAQSLGCLCRLDAKFLKGKPNNWVHSFGVFEFMCDGSYTFSCIKIINGKFAYNGKIYSGQ